MYKKPKIKDTKIQLTIFQNNKNKSKINQFLSILTLLILYICIE